MKATKNEIIRFLIGNKIERFFLMWIAVSIIFFVLCFYYAISFSEQEFDAELFKAKGYTQEEIELFNDIAFLDGRIRKWETDIKIEIKGVPDPKAGSIDSAINEIAPLIKPLNMEIVKGKGNIIVERGVYTVFDKLIKPAKGRAEVNPGIVCPAINSARIIERRKAGTKTLLHELEHAIGLRHPRKSYPFLMKIIGHDSPQWNDSIRNHPDKQFHLYTQQLSEQEKKVIQMLYSPEIKSGLTRKTFMKKMGIQDNPKIWDPPIVDILATGMPYIFTRWLYATLGVWIFFYLIHFIKRVYKKI